MDGFLEPKPKPKPKKGCELYPAVSLKEVI